MHQSPLTLRFPLRLWRRGSRLDASQGRGGRSPQCGRGKHAAGPARGGLGRRRSRRTVCWSSRKTASTSWSRYQTAEPTRSRDATPLAPRGPVRHDDRGHDAADASLRHDDERRYRALANSCDAGKRTIAKTAYPLPGQWGESGASVDPERTPWYPRPVDTP